MLSALYDKLIRQPFYSRVYTDTWEDIGDGGPTCYKELTIQFRVTIAVCLAIIQAFVMRWALRQARKKFGQMRNQGRRDLIVPHWFEILCGLFSAALFICQFFYKTYAGKGIFLFNPCHVVLVMEAYILLTNKSEKGQVMYANVISLLFGPVCGLLFAVNVGLDLPFEVEMYWIEHYQSAIINPLALALSGRYHERKFFHPYYRLIGFAFFSLYHRVVLLPLSLGTWANLDQTLCHGATDPFWPLFGDWYYLMADFYIPIASNLIGYTYLIVCEILAAGQSLVVKEVEYVKEKVDKKSK
jgi:hypothetical protein